MKIGIASDHAGFELKSYVMKNLDAELHFTDFGTFGTDSVDYPDFVHPLAAKVNNGELDCGIVICATGNGVSMTANKYINVRAALCWNEEITKLARQHNNANILAMPAKFVDKDKAVEMVRLFLNTDFDGGRHLRRIEKIRNLING